MLPSSGISLLNWACSWASSLVGEQLGSYTPVRSNEINEVFRLEFARETLYLKIGPHLQREYERLQWLEGRLPCPRPVGFMKREGTDHLLMAALEGNDLAELSASLPPRVIVERLATALNRLHAAGIAGWPFGDVAPNNVLIHGDACLPNFIYRDGELRGYIDVGDLAVDEPEVDLAAAVWSLQYNLGPGHGLAFLREYGQMDANEERVEALRRKYELGPGPVCP